MKLPPVFGVLCALLMTGCTQSPPPPPQAAAPPRASPPTSRSLSSLGAMSRALATNTTRCPFGHANIQQIPGLGGCTFWSPEWNQTIICLQCGYGHDPAQATWERGSTDLKAFQTPLDPLTTAFPILAAESKPQYYQSVLATRSVHEGILYRSVETPAALEPQVAAYLNDQKISTTRSELADTAAQTITLAADTPTRRVRVQLLKSADASKTQVTFELIPN
jgi:hypothetical protein